MKKEDWINLIPIVNIEISMPNKQRKAALKLIENIMPILEQHLIKVAYWGNRKSWKDEIVAWAIRIQKIRSKGKSTYYKPQDYEDEMVVYSDNTGKGSFNTDIYLIGRKMTKIKPVRTEEEARQLVIKWQKMLCLAWSKGQVDKDFIEKMLTG